MTTRTPDHTPDPSRPEYVDEERTVSSLAHLEQWRAYQKDLLAEYRSKATEPTDAYVAEFTGGIDESLDEYLATQGVTPDSPNYADVKGFFREASIDRINDEQWYTSPAARGEDPDDTHSQRDVFSKKARERVETPAGNPEPGTDPDSEEALAEKAEKERRINEAREAVKEAREQWSDLSSKRQGRLFSKRYSSKREYTEKDYNDKVNELGRLELEDVINNDEISDEDKNVAVIDYLFKEQAELRELTTEKLKGTKVSKFIKFMNKGGLMKRILKGVTLGAAAGVAGTLLAGAVGATLVATGTVAASRLVRGFALGDKDKRGMATVDESIDKDAIASRIADTDVDGDVFDKAGSHFNEVFENDTRHEQKKRRRAALVGLGAVAAGAAAAHGAHLAYDAMGHHAPQAFHPFGGNHHQPSHGGGSASDGPSAREMASDYYPKTSAAHHLVEHSLPSSHGYDHPWTWAKDVIDHHNVTTHKTPEAWLHELSDRAQKAGHEVEWHGSGKHEWIRIDGKEDRAAIDILRQFAKK